MLRRRLDRAEADGIEIGIKTVERGGGTTKRLRVTTWRPATRARRRLKRLAQEAPQ